MNRAITILISCSIFLANAEIYAATIKKIVKEKYALIDGGTNDGFMKKTIVCFSQNGKRKACGRVVKASKTKAYVRIKKSKISRLKPGFVAEIYQKGGQSKTASNTSAESYIRINPAYIADLVSPVSFNKLIYKRPFDENEQIGAYDTFWSSEGTTSSEIQGAGLSIGFDIGSFQLVPGARIRITKPVLTRDYYETAKNNSIDTFTEAQGIGAYLDFYYYKLTFGIFSINLGAGLDADISDVSISGDLRSEDEGQEPQNYYKANSSLTTISIRNNIVFDLFIDPIGFQLGIFVLAPVTSSQSFAADDSNDPFVKDYLKETTVSEDIKSTLDHRTNTVGAQLYLSSYFAF